MTLRHVTVSRPWAGRSIVQVLQARLRLPSPLLYQLLRRGKVRLDQRVCRSGNQKVRPGQTLSVDVAQPPAKKKPKPRPGTGPDLPRKKDPQRAFANLWLPRIGLVYLDEHILVVNKPAGLTTVRHKDELEELGKRKRFLPPTLVDLVPRLLKDRPPGGRVRAVHRLDRDTSGLLVLARTDQAEQHLGRQFRGHAIERRYLALVRGQATSARIESFLIRDRGDGRRGSAASGGGQQAITHVQVLEELGDCTMVECRLETGRTHQVRIHLGERGTPLCGETIYDRPLHGQPLPDPSAATRPMLHAATLAYEHPKTGQRQSWTCPLPGDMQQLLNKLRRSQA